MTTEEDQQEGEYERRLYGIDGTMGDAQDVDHPFLASLHGPWCCICGLAENYRRHRG